MVDSLPLYGNRFYRNPLRDSTGQAPTNPDPFVMKFQGHYYCYATDDKGIKVSVSRDLVQWQALGYALQEEGRTNYWAPCVLYASGSFYMYYSNVPVEDTNPQNEHLRLAVSTAPGGPFQHVKTLFQKFSIDPEVVKDGESNYYLFYCSNDATDTDFENTGSSILVGRLLELDKLAGEPRPVIMPTLEEEKFGENAWDMVHDWYTIEGATYMEHHGYAYLLYSANTYAGEDYYIGYALAERDVPIHKLEWEKYPNNYTYYALVKRSQNVEGTGHTTLVKAPNNVDTWLLYHGRDTNEPRIPEKEQRTMRLDRLFFDGDTLMAYAPTTTEQAAPAMPTFQEFYEEEGTMKIQTGQAALSQGGWATTQTPFLALYEKKYQYYHLETDFSAKPSNIGSKDGVVIAYLSKEDYTSVYLRSGTSTLTVEQVKNGIHSILASFPLKGFNATFNQNLHVVRCFSDYEFYLNGSYIGKVILEESPAQVGICSAYTATVFHYFALTETVDLYGKHMQKMGNFFAADVPVLINSANQLAAFRRNPVTLTTEFQEGHQYSLTYTLPNAESRVTCRLQLGMEELEVVLEPTKLTIEKLNVQKVFPLAKNDKSTVYFLVMDQKLLLLFKNTVYQQPLPSGLEKVTCRLVLKKAALDSYELVRVANGPEGSQQSVP